MKTFLDGTDLKKAIEYGEKKKNCHLEFKNCPDEISSIITAVSNYLAS